MIQKLSNGIRIRLSKRYGIVVMINYSSSIALSVIMETYGTIETGCYSSILLMIGRINFKPSVNSTNLQTVK